MIVSPVVREIFDSIILGSLALGIATITAFGVTMLVLWVIREIWSKE